MARGPVLARAGTPIRRAQLMERPSGGALYKSGMSKPKLAR